MAVASAVVIPGPYASPLLGPAIHGPIGPIGPLGPIAKIAAPIYPAITKIAAPVVAKVAAPEPYDPNPQYSYSYDVHVSIPTNNVTKQNFSAEITSIISNVTKSYQVMQTKKILENLLFIQISKIY